MINAYMNWSGGKDSSLALHRLLQDKQYDIRYLLTSVNSTHDRISMHGVRRSLLQAQAKAIGIPLQTIELLELPSMEAYENNMLQKVGALKDEGLTHAIFGDIFLEDLRKYREEKLQDAGIQCVFPLWKIDTKELMDEFLDAGFKAIIVCVNEQYLDKSFCGRIIDRSFVRDLPHNVDVCGENGEYHSFVFDGPIFKQPVAFSKGELVSRSYNAPATDTGNNAMDKPSEYNFYFFDLIPG
jgi:uncharacterized protein (TIGR00290 family)